MAKVKTTRKTGGLDFSIISRTVVSSSEEMSRPEERENVRTVWLYYRPNIPLAIVEAKKYKPSVGDGMQQPIAYTEALDIPLVYTQMVTASWNTI